MLNDLVARTPAQCTHHEIKAFSLLASNGGEVHASAIERGIDRAQFLLWIGAEHGLCAVAALKNPFQRYRDGVFKKSASPLSAVAYPFEFGYAVTDENHRRQGHCRALLRKALELANGQGTYATVRTNNEGMRYILEEGGFKRSGNEYRSTQRDASLVLYLWSGN
jgi:predicted GNAT family N-acyltransferase